MADKSGAGEDTAKDDAGEIVEGVAWQARHSELMGAPVTARIVRGLFALMTQDSQTGRALAEWKGRSREEAMPLRLAGGFHHLHLTGDESRLAQIYAGAVTDQAGIDAILLAVTRDHDARLRPWLNGPPQTNEAGRSASLMAGLLWLADRLAGKGGAPVFELLELGASAGANTMMDRFAFDLGGVRVGPPEAPVLIRPEWKGPPPPAASVAIASIRGCDRAPVDLSDPDQALRLKSYCWPENEDRHRRLDAIVAMARERPPLVDRADAADWTERQLALAQAAGTCRVLFHSIVWQYLDPSTQARIEAAMEHAGARATPERPLGWVMLETNRKTFRHELSVRYWPGGEDWAVLAEAQAHGAWVEWYAR